MSNTDLHIATDNMRFGLYDNLVLYDIDGQTRSTTTPDVGADEYDTAQQVMLVQAAFGVNSNTICTGTSVTFTHQSTGSPTSWQWSFPGGTPDISTSQYPTVQYGLPGTYPVTLVVSNGGSTDSLTDSNYINVILQPFVYQIGSTPAICAGDSAQLTANLNTGSVQWQAQTEPGVFTDIPGADSVVYNTGPLPFYYTYRLIATNGMCVDSNNIVTVAVNPLPAVTTSIADTAICPSDTATICALGFFTSYKWNTRDTTPCITTGRAGTYYVAVTDSNGCTAISDNVYIYEFTVVPVHIQFQGDTLSIVNNEIDYISYQWICMSNSHILDTTPTIVFTYADCMECTGAYCITTDTNGCKSNSDEIICEGLPQLDESADMKLYPNPAVNSITIDIVNGTTGINQVEIYDVLGRVALSKQYVHAPTGLLNLDVTTLSPGIYFVLVRTNDREYLQRMVKE